MISEVEQKLLRDIIDKAYGADPKPSEALKPDGNVDYELGDTLASFIMAECHDGMCAETLGEARVECARMMRTAADQLERVAHALEQSMVGP